MINNTLLESQDYILVYAVILSEGWNYVIKDKNTTEVIDFFKSYREAKLKFYETVPKLEIELYGLRVLDRHPAR